MDETPWPELIEPARQERDRLTKQRLLLARKRREREAKDRREALLAALRDAVEAILGQEPEAWESAEKAQRLRSLNADRAALIRDHIAWLREQPL